MAIVDPTAGTVVPVLPPPSIRFEDVLERLGEHGRPADEALLRSVYEFAGTMHGDQVRRSGEPYLMHPLAVAWILADLKFDQTCVAVALLHDVLEDTRTTRNDLVDRFGEEIAALVDGVTKIGRHAFVRKDEVQAETFRKMILASVRDVRVIVVKLADRLHNMMTLQHLPPEKRRRISRETLAIYAPIAHRLGMSRVKGDLEDLAFYWLYSHQFVRLQEAIEERLTVAKDAIVEIRDRLRQGLEEAGIEADISYRVKRYYSIHQKLRRQEIEVSQLYDYLAYRVVTSSVRDTYASLGIVHQAWRPIPGRFKDYVAMPKPNGYQSLHTTLIGDRGQPFEVQIRTREMDLIAEEGIAAHWNYKEQREGHDPNILWLRQILEWQQDVQDPRTFLASLELNLYPDEVYVFTPKGDVFSFPRGVTPLDVAYKIHTDLGHRCVGARVNGRLVPLRTSLQNGDMVEILTSPTRTPSRDWLSFVVTPRAKAKIRHWLSTEQKQRAVEIGRKVVEKELRRMGVGMKRFMDANGLAPFLADEGLAGVDDLLSRLGFGKLQVRTVVRKILPELGGEDPTRGEKIRRAVQRLVPRLGNTGPVEVRGHDDLLAFRAKCCNPLPGDEIVGFVTRGRGVSVHSAVCKNVRNLLYDPEREISVKWGKARAEVFRARIMVETEDHRGMLAGLTKVVAETDTNITNAGAKTTETGQGLIELEVEVRDRKHLDAVVRGLRGTPGVLRVSRKEGQAIAAKG